LVHINRRVFWGGIALAALTLFGCSHNGQSPKLSSTSGISAAGKVAARKVYRYSVVPGGVYSAEELAVARRTDPVVKAHYADFGDGATVRKLSADMLVYVSYRKADRVYWSSTKHRVCKGESILTDGKNMARTRCGNRLSATPQQPTIGNEPGAKAFDTPEEPLLAGLPDGPLFFPSEGLPTLTFPGETHSGAIAGTPPSPTGARADILPAAAFLPQFSSIVPAGPLLAPLPGTTGPGGGTTPVIPTTPITPTIPASIPEPGSLAMFLVAAAAAAMRRRTRRT
jgi:hypothetical protein